VVPFPALSRPLTEDFLVQIHFYTANFARLLARSAFVNF
jgi:hypothetical protein